MVQAEMEYANLVNQLYIEIEAKRKWLSPREIKAVRGHFKLTQVDFANLLGVSYGTYKNWEIGHRIPTSPAMALLYVAKDYPDVFLKNRKNVTKV